MPEPIDMNMDISEDVPDELDELLHLIFDYYEACKCHKHTCELCKRAREVEYIPFCGDCGEVLDTEAVAAGDLTCTKCRLEQLKREQEGVTKVTL